MEHEYNFNLCYCLVEYAREDENLMKELTPFFLQLSKENAIFFKKNSKKHDMIVQKVDQIWKQMIINRVEIEIMLLTVSLLDVLMEIYSIPFPNDSESRCIERFNQSSERFIKTFGDSRLLRIESFAKPLRTKQGKVYQFLNEYAKKTSECFQEPILSYLRREVELLSEGNRFISIENPNEVLMDVKRSFNLKVKDESLMTLSNNEVLEILAAMAFSCSIEPLKNGSMPTLSDKKWGELLNFTQENLLIFAMEYLAAKTHEKNRNLLFKLSDTTDLITLRQLETELNEMKKRLKNEKQQQKELTKTLNVLKAEQSKAILQAVAEKEKNLIEANRVISKQAQENEALKSELEKYKALVEVLQTQLIEQAEVNHLDEAFTLSEEALSHLNQPSILFVGGHPNTVHRLKTLLPLAKFFEIDKNYDAQFSKTIRQVFIFGDYVNHGMVYQVSKFISAPKRVLFGSNVDQLLNQCLTILRS